MIRAEGTTVSPLWSPKIRVCPGCPPCACPQLSAKVKVSRDQLPLPSVFGGSLVGWQKMGIPGPPPLSLPPLQPSQRCFALSPGAGAPSRAEIWGQGHGWETSPGCPLLSRDPGHIHSRSRGFVESRSFMSSGFRLGSGGGADLGVCLHGKQQTSHHPARMKSPHFTEEGGAGSDPHLSLTLFLPAPEKTTLPILPGEARSLWAS